MAKRKAKEKAPDRFDAAASEEHSRRQRETVRALLKSHPDGDCTEAEWIAAYRATK